MDTAAPLPMPGPGGRLDAPLAAGCAFHVRGTCAFRDTGHGRMVFLRQVHGARIVRDPQGGEEADGMILRRGEGRPALKLADCASLFIASRGFLGAVHAGWRGLASGAVEAIVRAFPEEPELAVAGPCICASCYGVGGNVRKLVVDRSGGEHPEGRLDLRAALVSQARAAGLACAIMHSGPCTMCRPDMFHSFRRDGTGLRNIAWLEG
ncbi:MAG: polyphenol oxidase family protein [Candidatus Fermentibacter sp.]|nr:polyphenol oxidase family protein [Candidatus Fermentibacter sp.]